MPSHRSLHFYSAGIRAAQVQTALSADGDLYSPALRRLLLSRFRVALEQLPDPPASQDFRERTARELTAMFRMLDGQEDSDADNFRVSATILAEALREAALTEGAEDEDEDRLWLALGLAIADMECYPPIAPPLRMGYRAGFPALTNEAAGGAPASWRWRDEAEVTRLVTDLSEDIGRLFPDYDDLGDEDRRLLPGATDDHWGWIALEKSQRDLRRGADDNPTRPRRRGRPRNPAVVRRDRIIRATARRHPGLGPADLLRLLQSQPAQDDLLANLTANIVRNALRRARRRS